MGLDTVELIISVEDRFGIHLPDREAETIVTVGDLYHSILGRLYSRPGPRCKTQHAFYRLRAALPQHLRSGFRIDVGLRNWLATPAAYPIYQNWQRDVALSLPPLAVPSWFTGLRVVTTLLTVGAVLYVTCTQPLLLPLALLAFGLTIKAFDYLDDRLRTLLPDTSVRAFTERFTVMHHARLLPTLHNDREVYDLLKVLIVEQLGVDPAEVHPGASFSYDLGVD